MQSVSLQHPTPTFHSSDRTLQTALKVNNRQTVTLKAARWQGMAAGDRGGSKRTIGFAAIQPPNHPPHYQLTTMRSPISDFLPFPSLLLIYLRSCWQAGKVTYQSQNRLTTPRIPFLSTNSLPLFVPLPPKPSFLRNHSTTQLKTHAEHQHRLSCSCASGPRRCSRIPQQAKKEQRRRRLQCHPRGSQTNEQMGPTNNRFFQFLLPRFRLPEWLPHHTRFLLEVLHFNLLHNAILPRRYPCFLDSVRFDEGVSRYAD